MSNFDYWNANPKGIHKEDCVCRAISMASGLPYKQVEYKLWLNSILHDCPMLCVCCYEHLIESLFGECEVYCGDNDMTVIDFANRHPYGIYIVRVPEHLTSIVDGRIEDIWDCSQEICDIAWKID